MSVTFLCNSGPGELRSFYSVLTERAACKLSSVAGGPTGEGGSVTCILGMPSDVTAAEHASDEDHIYTPDV